MKRNILLLTAVVLVAVMLSGCALLPWTWGKVEITWDVEDKADFNTKDFAKWIKKNTVKNEVEIRFADSAKSAERVWTYLEKGAEAAIGISPGELKDKDGTVIGITLEFPVAEKAITVKGVKPEA